MRTKCHLLIPKSVKLRLPSLCDRNTIIAPETLAGLIIQSCIPAIIQEGYSPIATLHPKLIKDKSRQNVEGQIGVPPGS